MSQILRAPAWISLACAVFLMDHTACAARLKMKQQSAPATPLKDGQHSDEEPIEDKKFSIWIQAISDKKEGRNHHVAVTDSTTLRDLKLEIQALTDWPLDYQNVFFHNKPLEENNATMRDIGVQPESHLRANAGAGLLGGLAYGGMREEWEEGYNFVGRLVHRSPNVLGQIEHGTCTALVQGKFALTAAHCFSVATGGEPQLDRWTLYTTSGERSLVSGRIHTHYNPDENTRDVAFVELDQPHEASPVVLDTTPIPPGEKVQIAGFGVDETGRSGNFAVGQFTTTPCSAQNRHLPIECASTTDASPTSTCGGDSGGPWWRMTKFQGKHRVFGVQSFGYDGGCGEPTKKSGIALLSAAKDWLSEYTSFEWYQDPELNVSAGGSSSTAPQVRVHQSSAPRSHHDEPVGIGRHPARHPTGHPGPGLTKAASIGSNLNKGVPAERPVAPGLTAATRAQLLQGNAERPLAATRLTADGTHLGGHPVVSRAPVRQGTVALGDNVGKPIQVAHYATGSGGFNPPDMQPRLVLPTTQIVNGWRIVHPRLSASRPEQENVWSASGL